MIRVLLADDHGVVRDGLRALLDNFDDITVVGVASNGREALQQAQSLQPDVVVMDIAMPELSGIEVADRLKDMATKTQVVFLSMHGSNEHVFRALQTGGLGYVLKESAGSEVALAIRAVHSGRRYLSSKLTESVVDAYIDQRHSESPLERLSAREREVLRLVADGKSSAEIANSLALSPKTVDSYRSRLMAKLGLSDLPSLVKFAIKHGLTSI